VNYNAHPVTSITFPHSSANIRPLVIRHNSYSVAYLFICDAFNEAVSRKDYITLNYRTING
jgi:hypothetical protein